MSRKQTWMLVAAVVVIVCLCQFIAGGNWN